MNDTLKTFATILIAVGLLALGYLAGYHEGVRTHRFQPVSEWHVVLDTKTGMTCIPTPQLTPPINEQTGLPAGAPSCMNVK